MDVTILKAFADIKINVAKMMISVFHVVENNAGKGENAAYQHFLHFLQCFQKASFSGVVKSWDYVVKSSCSFWTNTEKLLQYKSLVLSS